MKRLLLLSMAFMGLAVPMTAHAHRGDGVVRTVYFSARDAKGTPVTDLTASDLSLKEGDKDYAIVSVAAATAPIQVSLLVDDAGTGAFQAAVAQFLETMFGHGQFAIWAFNPQPSKLTADFTEDADALKKALTLIGPRGKITTMGQQMMGAVGEAATELQRHKASRAAIIVLTVGGEQAQSHEAEPALNALKNSGASLNVVTLAGINVGPVLGDGPKRSGGVTQQIAGGNVPATVLSKIADNLLQQYVLTYNLPDGVKPNERLSLTTSRKGVTLLAPSRVPDK
jgi:hypothetical protein